MLRVSFLFLVLLPAAFSFADDPQPKNSLSTDEVAKLIDRIELLEKRIRELEQQSARPNLAYVPQHQPYSTLQPAAPRNQPYIPNTNSPSNHYQPAFGYSAPYAPQSVPQSAPQYQPNPQNAVPDSWKPFNFNGMQYYIIPIDEADRLNRLQGNG